MSSTATRTDCAPASISLTIFSVFFFFKQKTAYEIGLGIPAEPLFRSMGDAGIKSAIQGSNVPNPDEAVPSFVSGAMAKAGKGLLEGTLQAGTSAVSDKLLDSVGLGGKSAADKGKDTRDYLEIGRASCRERV